MGLSARLPAQPDDERAATERALDPEKRLQHALDLGYRFLGKRDRTVAEVRRHLEARDVEPATVDEALDELARAGYLDDERYARRFAEDRRALDGWGRERIERRLAEVGVARDVIAGALSGPGLGDELTAAVELLRRRLPAPPADDAGRNRALGLLARRGYELELAHDAIRAFAREAG
ncbi:MAG: regulatory protein RecX [Solirubrobacteraceae bacterium]